MDLDYSLQKENIPTNSPTPSPSMSSMPTSKPSRDDSAFQDAVIVTGGVITAIVLAGGGALTYEVIRSNREFLIEQQIAAQTGVVVETIVPDDRRVQPAEV